MMQLTENLLWQIVSQIIVEKGMTQFDKQSSFNKIFKYEEL